MSEFTESVDAYVKEHFESEYGGLLANFKEIQAEQYLLFAKKNHDYGMRNVMAGSELETADDVKFALTGLWFRISDKVSRWRNLLQKPNAVDGESLLDTMQDIANYATIAQMVARRMWKNETSPYEVSTEDCQEDTGE